MRNPFWDKRGKNVSVWTRDDHDRRSRRRVRTPASREFDLAAPGHGGRGGEPCRLCLLAASLGHDRCGAACRWWRRRQYCLTQRTKSRIIYFSDAGWSSLAARRAHNPKVVGSNPTPATKHKNPLILAGFCFCSLSALSFCLSGMSDMATGTVASINAAAFSSSHPPFPCVLTPATIASTLRHSRRAPILHAAVWASGCRPRTLARLRAERLFLWARPSPFDVAYKRCRVFSRIT